MKKNMILPAILTLLISASTTFAQQKVDNFLGSWKLAETGNKWLKKFGTESMAINVKEAGGKLVIERSGNSYGKTITTASSTEAYKISEDTETSVIGGWMGGVQYRWLRILKPNKLQFLTKLNTDNGVRLTRITWVISEDGKTLTVRQDFKVSYLDGSRASGGGYSSNKLVFTRQ